MGCVRLDLAGLAALPTPYVTIDQFRGNPEATVMKWGWVLVTLYMGPIALLLYILTDKETPSRQQKGPFRASQGTLSPLDLS